jgi:hypothetical protein
MRKPSRRSFLAGAVLGTAGCRQDAGARLALTGEEARTLDAICDQLIPADQDPGAAATGAVVFIDRQLAGPYAATGAPTATGWRSAAALSRKMFGKPMYDQLAARAAGGGQRLETDARPFFEMVLAHTMQGFYGSPRHGGNRDYASWRMLRVPASPVRGRILYDLRQGKGFIAVALAPVDAVVIGAGAGGGVIAKELACAGMRVVLLERGRWVTAWDDRKDDLRNQRTSVLGAPFGPDDERNPRVAVDRRRPRAGGAAERWRLLEQRCLRGQRHGELRRDGLAVHGAGLPHEVHLRMPGGEHAGRLADQLRRPGAVLRKGRMGDGRLRRRGARSVQAPRRRGLPMPPLPPNREYEILKPAALRKGWHPFDIPMLRNSVPYNGRGPCMRCRWCVGFACESTPKTAPRTR